MCNTSAELPDDTKPNLVVGSDFENLTLILKCGNKFYFEKFRLIIKSIYELLEQKENGK